MEEVKLTPLVNRRAKDTYTRGDEHHRFGKTHSEKVREGMRKHNPYKIKIVGEIDGSRKTFISIGQAAQYLIENGYTNDARYHTVISSLSKVINGKRISAYGFKFKKAK
jgi:hypothetical protein